MTTQLTEEQKQYYLKHSSNCPFCNSGNIEGQSLKADGNYAWATVYCLNSKCRMVWRDCYTLTAIEVCEEIQAT
ncbi:hypothetical protein LCGC14_2433400 [marine sediment metagenome]|uniref:Uncharacterized protein n=1 Tax=marine sediment metagenome TaxID=412755 RepID=A0A0F9C8L3_9ZZZZ